MTFFRDFPALIPLTAALLTESWKLLWFFFQKWKIEARDILQSGGMPSGHSVFVSSLLVTVFLKNGGGSTEFAIAFVFAIVVMYDAMKIRRAAGRHAEELNRMLGEKKFVERLGHTPLEVFVGFSLGSLFAYLVLSPTIW